MATQRVVRTFALAGLCGASFAGGFIAVKWPDAPPDASQYAEAWSENDAITIVPLDDGYDYAEPAEAIEGTGEALEVIASLTESLSGPSEAVEIDIARDGPTLDLLRIERDGFGLVGGRANPNEKLLVMSGEETVGETVATSAGDYVVLLEEPLAAGNHRLSVVGADGGAARVSPDAAIIALDADEAGPPLAVIERAGEPTQLVSLPRSAPDYDTEALARADDAVREFAAFERGDAEGDNMATASIERAAGVLNAGVIPSDIDPAPTASIPSSDADTAMDTDAELLIEAVEVEGSSLFVAGHTEHGTSLNLYVDGEFAGRSRPMDGDRFLFELDWPLAVGPHRFRVDALTTRGVVARATVPYVRTEDETATAVVAGAGSPDLALGTPVDGDGSTSEPMGAERTLRQPELVAADRSVIIRRDDTLWHISRRVYGSGFRYTTIYQANSDQIGDPNLIYPGQIFDLPDEASSTVR